MLDTIDVVRAGPDDLDALIELLTEINEWLHARGITGQWPPVIPRDFIGRSLEQDEVYLAKRGAELLGTVTLQWSDSGVWGDVPPDAVYVHRLAIRRKYAGQGMGQLLLNHAEERARAEGKPLVRLDCWAENPYLVRYYQDAGFRLVREVLLGSWRGCLFERTVTAAG